MPFEAGTSGLKRRDAVQCSSILKDGRDGEEDANHMSAEHPRGMHSYIAFTWKCRPRLRGSVVRRIWKTSYQSRRI